MKSTTIQALWSMLVVRVHGLVVVSCLVLAVMGQMPRSSAGWFSGARPISCPHAKTAPSVRRWRKWRARPTHPGPGAEWFVQRTWRVPLLRSILLMLLWFASGQVSPGWVMLLPWCAWLWRVLGWCWPRLACQPEWRVVNALQTHAQGAVLWLSLLGTLQHVYSGPGCARFISREPGGAWSLALCCAPSVTLTHEVEAHRYTAELHGQFTLAVSDAEPYRLRFLLLFLRLLEVPDLSRPSRRTRDGRMPFVRQQMLQAATGVWQPTLSEWERAWQRADWALLLSQQQREFLTYDLQQTVIQTWAHWPLWSVAEVYQFLNAQGVRISLTQIQQAAHESGWQLVRTELARLCVQHVEQLRVREAWLIGDLLQQIEVLLRKLEEGQTLTKEEQLSVVALQQATQAAGFTAHLCSHALPWLWRVEQILFGSWERLTDDSVHCLYCGSTDVARKSRQPRLKKFSDAQGQVQTIEVYRYYCHNPECDKGSFTNLPPGLLPYSAHRLEVHVLALQMYEWSRSTYRLTGQALNVSSMTVYRWVSAFGHELLPIAALFGVVKSSGVVGVDEKWVLVPKNDKPTDPKRQWMYVYLAVDAYTYDLLHIALYANNNADSARAFLFALRAKGYHPRAFVTDLRRDYGPAIALVFPKAAHHCCLFHASQWMHQQLKLIYGQPAIDEDQSVMTLREQLDACFSAQTKRTAQKHYDELMALREPYVKTKPEVAAIFDSLELHWPKLLNGIESELMPRTNNVTELVIRRFDQHYQNFCGFDTIATAQQFLGVFEKVYRFTPFSDDAQPRIRGQSPLELAGYDVKQLPMASVCRGWAISPTTTPSVEVVPNS